MIFLGYLKLVGGSGPHEGNVFVNGRPVCDDHWDNIDAGVVCRWPFLSKMTKMIDEFVWIFQEKGLLNISWIEYFLKMKLNNLLNWILSSMNEWIVFWLKSFFSSISDPYLSTFLILPVSMVSLLLNLIFWWIELSKLSLNIELNFLAKLKHWIKSDGAKEELFPGC